MTKDRPKVVIVGAGFGGLEVAKKLKDEKVDVTVIDKSNHHLFQPLLYQVATAGLSPADIACPIRSALAKQKNTEVLLAEVTGVDVKDKKVLLEGRAIQYDFLVLATGARHSYFGQDHWENFAPGLKTIGDATKIRRKILLAFEKAEAEEDPEIQKKLLTFVIVGAGPTGVELAGAIAELASKAMATDFRRISAKSARIILVEAGSRVLASFPESLSEKAKQALETRGVEVLTSSRVEHIDQNGATIQGRNIATEVIIWAAGVQATPVGHWLGVEVDPAGRVKVRSDLTAPGMDDVFVIGDAALFMDRGKQLPGVCPVAIQQGKFVSQVIKDRISGRESTPTFHYLNKGNLATVGRSFAVADFGFMRTSGLLAWFMWAIVHIYFLIDFQNRVLVVIQWLWRYITFHRGARLIVDP